MQHLWTKKTHNLLGEKNHTNSWDKKLRNLSGQKNHATCLDKKIMLLIGPFKSKLVHKAPNCFILHQIYPSLSKLVQIG